MDGATRKSQKGFPPPITGWNIARNLKTNPWLQNGFLLNWAPWPESNGGTSLLDTTPGTPMNDDSKEDCALVIAALSAMKPPAFT